MGMIDLGKLDRGGVVKDVPSYRLAPNEFNDVLDVDFENGGIVPAVQEAGVFNGIAGNPVHLEEVEGSSGFFNFVYFLTNQAFVWSGSSFWEITNPDGMESSSDTNRWNGGFYHGWWVWTNGAGIPQKWNPTDVTLKMANLDNWPSGLRIRFLRPYLNFLVGLSYTSLDFGFSKQTVIWSDQADPGTLPNWDITDPASKAGVYSLTADSDPIEGAAELRGELFIYKRSSVWAMRYVGGTFVMNFALRFSERGLLNSRCVVALEGAHFCIDRAGFYIHNGVSITPVGEGRVWEYFSDQFADASLSYVFIEYEEAKNRIWIFYSTTKTPFADRVLIYDLKNQTWTFRKVQEAVCAVRGSMRNAGAASPWDHFQGVWENDLYPWGTDLAQWSEGVSWDTITEVTAWDDAVSGGVQRSIHYASSIDPSQNSYDPLTGLTTSGNVKWYGTTQYPPIWYIGRSGARLPGYVQRLGFCVFEQDSTGSYVVDQTVYKHLTELYAELSDGAVEFRIGTQTSTKATPEWLPWVKFDPLLDFKLDPNCVEKYLAFEIRGLPEFPVKWKLSGISLNIQNGGRY